MLTHLTEFYICIYVFYVFYINTVHMMSLAQKINEQNYLLRDASGFDARSVTKQ